MDRLKRIFSGLLSILLVPAGLWMLVYLFLPLQTRFSWRWMVLLGVQFILIELLSWLQMRFFVIPAWKVSSHEKRAAWVLVTCLLTCLLFTFVGPTMIQVMEKFSFLAPQESLELRPVFDSVNDRLDLWKVKINDQRVPNSALSMEGIWREEEIHLWTSDPNARLVVTDRVPYDISISFWRSPSAGQAEVRWDGRYKIIDLRGEENKEAVFRFIYDPAKRKEPLLSLCLRLLALPGWFGLAFLATGIFFQQEHRPVLDESIDTLK